jgi:hypothetical protein
MADVEASGLWPGKVVTEISEAVPCWVAEAEHQDTSSAIQTAHPALPAAGLEAATSRDPAQRRAFERTAIRAADVTLRRASLVRSSGAPSAAVENIPLDASSRESLRNECGITRRSDAGMKGQKRRRRAKSA